MSRDEWLAQLESLGRTREVICGWPATGPDPHLLRCEQSLHRTLAHLRACQEQWLLVVTEFLSQDNPNVRILHPWRKFDHGGYSEIPWEEHKAKFLEDRRIWLSLKDSADWNRGGKMNRNPRTVGDLTQHLATHEAYHVNLM